MYYHIYFNNNEIKRNYLDKNDNVEKLNIIIDYQIKSFEDYLMIVNLQNIYILKNIIEIT